MPGLCGHIVQPPQCQKRQKDNRTSHGEISLSLQNAVGGTATISLLIIGKSALNATRSFSGTKKGEAAPTIAAMVREDEQLFQSDRRVGDSSSYFVPPLVMHFANLNFHYGNAYPGVERQSDFRMRRLFV
jgi:hypothetical protein